MIQKGDRVRHVDIDINSQYGLMEVWELKNGYAVCRHGYYNNFAQDFPINELKKSDKQFKTKLEEFFEEQEKEEAFNQKLVIFRKFVNDEISKFKSLDEMWAFLIDIKQQVLTEREKAGKLNHKYWLECYQKAIDEIIDPQIEDLKAKIDVEENLSLGKQTSISVVPTKPSKVSKKHTLKKRKVAKKVMNKNSTKKKVAVKLPKGFSQIECDASANEIRDFFLVLSKEKNKSNKEPYMSKEDVLELIENNFSVFEAKPTGKYFKINITKKQKIRMSYFVYEFKEWYDAHQGANKKYVNFLIHNFIAFKKDKHESLYKNFSNVPVPTNRIPTIKHK